MKAYFDSNVLVAALFAGHEHHAESFALAVKVMRGEMRGYISAHGLAEVYSVLTRSPFARSYAVSDIKASIEDTIAGHFSLVEVTAQSHRAALDVCASAGWRGGRIHDAVHVQAARQADCDVVFTYDVGHFQSVAGDWVQRVKLPPLR